MLPQAMKITTSWSIGPPGTPTQRLHTPCPDRWRLQGRFGLYRSRRPRVLQSTSPTESHPACMDRRPPSVAGQPLKSPLYPAVH